MDEVSDGVALVEYLVRCWMEDSKMAGLRLVVTDQRMPGFCGTRIIEAVRLVGEDLPVLLVTAFPEPALVEHALELGVTGVIAKPVDQEDFLARVRAVIGERE